MLTFDPLPATNKTNVTNKYGTTKQKFAKNNLNIFKQKFAQVVFITVI